MRVHPPPPTPWKLATRKKTHDQKLSFCSDEGAAVALETSAFDLSYCDHFS